MAKQSSIPASWFMAGFSNPVRQAPIPPHIRDVAAKADSRLAEPIELYVQRRRAMGPVKPARCITCNALESDARDTIAGGRMCECGSRVFE